MSKSTYTMLALLMSSTALLGASPALAQENAPQDEVVATGVFIPNEKKVTSEISSVLNEELFETTGAGDIAGALTRVTGLSLSQGKFVIVRGLNERYSHATLNGSPLPSPEPLRRVAPLDLFPTAMLSDVVVQKTYSPQYSGEFGGGAIDMATKALPNDSFLEIGISGSVNTETTLRKGLIYEGSDSDWLGFDDGLRDLPATDADGNIAPGANFDTFNTLIIDGQDNIPGNIGGRITAGKRMDMDSGMSVGLLATVGYENEWESRTGESNTGTIDGGELVRQADRTKTSTENAISLNGMASLGVEFNENHEIKLIGFATRQSSAEARILQGTDIESRILRQDFTEWFEREVYMGQVLGTHYFPNANDLEVKWRASYAQAGRDAPYERRVNYEDFEDGQGFRFQFNRPGTNNSTRFSELDDETIDAGIDASLPLSFNEMDVELKFGGAYLDKSRDSFQSSYRYFGSIPAELRNSRIDLIFSDPVVDAGILEIRRGGTSGFPDISNAGLEVFGAYGGLDVAINENLRLAVGARFEDSTQSTAIEESTVADSRFQFDDLAKNYILPAATLTYTFADNWQLRLAASQTINRPQFRELTPTIFVNTDTDERYVGNPFLTNSESTNLDARLEYYFAPSQFVTAGVFYKDLKDPIEEFIFNGLGDSNATSFINAPSATLFGVELEFEKKFALADMANTIPMFGNDNFAGTDLVIRTNYTYTDSSVSADGDIRITPPAVDPARGVAPLLIPAAGLYTDGRKLQGQSDHLANVQIGLEDAEKGYTATLLLNYSSQRIRAVEDGVNGLPAIDEQLPVSVDFVFTKDFTLNGGEYSIGFKAQNLLDDGYEATQTLEGVNSILIETYDIGRTFAASLKRKF